MRLVRLFPYTETKPESLYDSIVISKRKPCKQILLEDGLNLKIKKRFNEYKLKRKKLEKLLPNTYSPQQKKCLEGCYDISTDSQKELLSLIKGKLEIHSKAYCSYCGINSPTTVDHYLPKSIFPEFSVLSYNLVPCCSVCNTLKDNNFINPITKKRLFFNYYFDEVPNDRYLFARITKCNGAFLVEFFYKTPSKLDINDIISSHFYELNIVTRLEDVANSYLDNIYQKNQHALLSKISPTQLKELLRLSTKVLEKNHGKNYWKVVLNRAILKSNTFFTPQ